MTSTKSTKSLSTQMSVTKNQTCTENWEDDLIEIPVQMVVTGENPISRNRHQHEWSINYENLAPILVSTDAVLMFSILWQVFERALSCVTTMEPSFQFSPLSILCISLFST
jgi:hypothetical protein